MKTAYAYARFSSDNQREESIDAQLRAIRAFCEREQISIVHVYTDRALSGTTDKRPQFRKMIEDAAAGDVDYVIVHKLDRFARNRFDSAFYRRQLKTHGVRLISVLEHFDDSPESIILESVIEGWNEYYSANLSREVMKGMKETALQCKHTGGRPPLGYVVNPDKTYGIDPESAETVKTIFRMYAEGRSYTEILRALDGCVTGSGAPFGKNSLSDILRNEKYTGTYIFNRSSSKSPDGRRNSHRSKDHGDMIRVPGGMPRIISDETFAAVQLRLRSHSQNAAGSARTVYLLSGKLICGMCGSVMSGATSRCGRNKAPYSYYVCGHRSRTGRCDMPRLSANVIEGIVLDALDQMLSVSDEDLAYIYQLVSDSVPVESDYIKSLRIERDDVLRRQENLARLLSDNPSSVLLNELRILEQREKTLTVAIDSASAPTLRPHLEEITAFCRQRLDVKKMSREDQKALIFRLVDRIIVNGYDDLEITFRIPVSNTDGVGISSTDGGGDFQPPDGADRLHQ